MAADIVMERVCRLPLDFYASNSKSMLDLIDESGVKNYPNVLMTEAISAYLGQYPKLIEQWLRWSENKRVSSGWYFRRESGGYAIGFRPKGETFHFTQPELACAEFVTREVRAMMEMPRAKRPRR